MLSQRVPMTDIIHIKHSNSKSKLEEEFLKSKDGSLEDFDILQLVLSYANPTRDVRAIATKLYAKFGSFLSIINSNYTILERDIGVSKSSIIMFKIIKEGVIRCAKSELNTKVTISSCQELISFLRISMGYANIELFALIYLNNKNMVIENEIVQQGTTDAVSIYPREIVKKAILIDASAVIMAHNHPSGKAKPSKLDIDITKNVIDAMSIFNIAMHDHIIITKNEYFSFKENGLI